MADSANPQYSSPGQLFGGQADYASTGAPGSQGAQNSDAMPDTAFHPVVSTPGASSQVPGNMPAFGVGADDVNLPAQTDIYAQGSDPLTGSHDGFASTGAGMGSGHQPHPNAGK